MEKREKKRWHEIDALYAIGIVLVLIGHSHSNDWSTFRGTLLEKIINFIYTFHMPLFFFISGFLFENSDRLTRCGFKKIIKDKAERLLVPYLFWTMLAVLPKYYLIYGNFEGLGFSYLINTLISPTAGVLKYFWFIQVLFVIYVLFSLLKEIIRNKKVYFCFTIACATILYFLPIESKIFSFSELKTMMIFFAVGALFFEIKIFAGNLIKDKRIILVMIIFVVITSVLLTELSYKSKMVSLFLALFMITVCWGTATMIAENRTVKWISSHNFTIYIFSWMFQAFMMAVCEHFSLGPYYTFVLMLSIGILGPAFVITVYNNISFFQAKIIKLILGFR